MPRGSLLVKVNLNAVSKKVRTLSDVSDGVLAKDLKVPVRVPVAVSSLTIGNLSWAKCKTSQQLR